jgi:hypothetical protein
MKTMTCLQLGGACQQEFKADTFEEMTKLSQQHGMEMFKAGDMAHLEAMQKMQDLMKNPLQMQEWFESKKKEFELL